ncbi:alpha/beta hydrolase [Micromonospora sp. NPDC048986]|uniref:alpha/beta hydrolase n=1 Tax=Micromonospora sp. NPDC048986 TaxID=3155644 RepID=UPI00340A6D40
MNWLAGRHVREVRAPRFFGARAAGLVLTTVVTLTAGLTGCTDSTPEAGRPKATPEAPSEKPFVGSTCKEQPVREPCQDISVDGMVRRYALLSPKSPTRDTVLVDLGGPGEAALSGTKSLSSFQESFPEISGKFNILVVEEPWVTRPVSDACSSALSSYYLRLHGGDAEGAARFTNELDRECRLGEGDWGFTPTSYAHLVSAISTQHNLQLKGFVGHSWGSARLTYLDVPSLDFSVLVRPFPVGTDAASLIAERARTLATIKPNGATQATTDERRSQKVTEFDRLSATVALGYVSDASLGQDAAAVGSGQDKALIGSLSDQLWKRYGESSLSPGMLAQLDEMCPLVGTGPPLKAIRTVTDLLTAQFAPCPAAPAPAQRATVAKKSCIAASPSDAVTPYRLVREHFGTTKTRFVDSTERSHGSFQGLTECLKVVLN